MVTYHIGHAPRLPRRERAARVFDRFGGYALGWAVVAGAAWLAYWGLWVAAVGALYLASVLCNPWRPKRPVRPAHAGSGSRAVHSGPGALLPRRPVTPLPGGTAA